MSGTASGARSTIEPIGVLVTLGVLLLAVDQLTAALVGSMLLFIARGLFGVLFMDALNRRIDSDCRSTINSLLGWVLNAVGLRASVFSLAALAAMAGLILLAPLGRSIDGLGGVSVLSGLSWRLAQSHLARGFVQRTTGLRQSRSGRSSVRKRSSGRFRA